MSTTTGEESARPSILGNISWLTAANVLVKPLWFVFITAFCMRVLGAAGYGVMSMALSLMTFAAYFSDLGTTKYTIREVARDEQTASRYFANLLTTRIVLALGAWGGALAVSGALGYGRTEMMALTAAGGYAMGMRAMKLCRAFFRAYEVLHYEAVSIFVEKGVVIGGGILMLWVVRTPAGALLGMGIGIWGALLLNVAWIHSRMSTLDFRLLSFSFIRKTFWIALPLGLTALFNEAFRSSGIVLLEALENAKAAGRFGAAFRIVEALQLAPSMVVAAVMPRLSSLYGERKRSAFQKLLFRSMAGLSAVALAAALFFSFFGPTVMHLIDPNPEFAEAGRLLQVLIWDFPLTALIFLFTATLIAADQQRFLAFAAAASALISVVLNILLIPAYSAYGTIWAFVITHLALLGSYVWWFYTRVFVTRQDKQKHTK